MWYSAADLAQRIRTAEQSPVFVIGSGVAAPVVPGTDAIVELIRRELEPHGAGALRDLETALAPAGNRYQIAFDLLLRICGPDVANRVIRHAVLSAREDAATNATVAEAKEGKPAACGRLNAQVDGWRLTPALTALGKLATAMARPSCRILTTNFDPLLAIAVRKAGGRAIAMALASDGNPMSADQDDAVLITQLHGDWYRADSLHTPSVLSADRPQLRAALRGIMADRLIVAFGYAGWDDVLTRAVADLMHESNARFDLRWAFREADSTEIETKYAALLQRVAQKRGTRVFMHTGVDANDFLPALARQFDAAGPSGGPTARREAPPTFQGDGSKPGKPRVYVSYSWRTKDLKKRAFDLAERLRSAGVDARLDLYYAESHHGFLPPEKRANDARPPWMIWQEEQIVEADRVLLICTKEYFESVEYPDDPSGKRSGAWHDVHFMIENLNSGRVGYNKFIPVGLGRYSEQSHFVPRFLEGSTYYDLDAGPGEGFGFDDLLRRFRTEFPRG